VAASNLSADPLAALRERRYLVLLVFAAVIGVATSAAAYWFLYVVNNLQHWVYDEPLPGWLGFRSAPIWWPLPVMAFTGCVVALTIRYLPGRGGRSPADGFQPGEQPTPSALPGIAIAAIASIGLGAVIGPEGPLVALGAGLAICATKLVRRNLPTTAVAVLAAAGSFAAIASLLGSPLLGAVFLLEAAGLGGAMQRVVLVPGLLASGLGALIFIGLDSWTGYGTFSLAIPNLPHFGRPDIAEFGWAIGIGLAAAVLGVSIRKLGVLLRPWVERQVVLISPVVGLAVAGLAIAFAEGSGKSSSLVLFSGQTALGPFLDHTASYSLAALVLLLACKGLAYGASLATFRGGPTFPAMFLGAVGGVALSHAPGLPMVAGAAMGIGAMTAVILRLPIVSVLLATLLLASDGLNVMPLVIVAVVVAYVAAERIAPSPPQAQLTPPAEPATAGRTDADS
jgi:H+/Cl- antiporter ClcA